MTSLFFLKNFGTFSNKNKNLDNFFGAILNKFVVFA
jgi:hypothetical protein